MYRDIWGLREDATGHYEQIRLNDYVEVSPTIGQMDNLYVSNEGTIALNDFVGTVVGSYFCKLHIEFGDFSNSSYRVSAFRDVQFALSVYQVGSTVYHVKPDLKVMSHGGVVTLLASHEHTMLDYEDIDIHAVIVSNLLQIHVLNNIANSALSLAGTLKARYSLKITQFQYV
jgi:hypothetical protein